MPSHVPNMNLTPAIIYARLTKHGTAVLETAVCRAHLARSVPAHDTVTDPIPCPDNEVLTCTVCATPNVVAVAPFPSWEQVDHYAPAADCERYVAILVVAYADRDRTRTITDPLGAARSALDLTRDDNQRDTVWHVYDRYTGALHRYEQAEFDRADLLSWETADSDEPGDQAADSGLRVAQDATSAYYIVGPHDTGWAVKLVQTYAGEELRTTPLGHYPDEVSAKQRAQQWESHST